MWGDNFRFEHRDAEVQALRSSVQIFCGEYDFTVSCLPREHAPDADFTLPRAEMEELIFNDVGALSALCSRHGTFGEAVLPGAFEPITGILLKVLDGNERQAFLETGSHYFFISMLTS